MQKEDIVRTSKSESLTLNLSLWPWPLSYIRTTRLLIKVYIFAKLFQNPFMQATVTFELRSWALHATSHPITVNFFFNVISKPFLEKDMALTSKNPCLTLNLTLWHWHWSYRPGSCVRHTASSRWIFVQSYFIFFSMHEDVKVRQGNSKVWPWIYRCARDLWGTDLGLAHNTATY